jgi:hypothetical protein
MYNASRHTGYVAPQFVQDMKRGNCKLCLQVKGLTHSHILSEFLYEPTYDDAHRFISLSSHPWQKTKPFEKGLREHLLCKDCEGQLARYEAYAANILRITGDYRTPDTRVIQIPSFDYQYFKLFGMSLIWRCHISKLHMFRAVKLGLHAERIRRMLAAEDAGNPLDYPFALIKIESTEHTDRIIIAPGLSRFQGHNAYIFMAYGFEWIFIVSGHSNSLPRNYPFVGLKAELVILVEYWSKQEFLQKMRKRMSKLIEKDERAT